MHLESMTIKNFRGYKEEQNITFESLTAFVGKNDVGKSTILEALSIFFGDGVVKPEASDFNVFTDSDTFEIGCTFSDLPREIVIDANAKTNLSSEYLLTEDGMLHVKKKWKKSAAKPKESVYIVCEHPTATGYNNLLEQKNKELKALLKKILSPEEIETKGIRLSNNVEMRQAIWESCKDLNLQTSEISVLNEDSKKIWENISKHLPQFALFQADRPSQDSDSEVQDPMKLAISTALAEPEIAEMLGKVERAVEEKATDLALRTHHALKNISPEIGEGLHPHFKTPPKWASQFGVSLETDHGISINKRGSGVRRLVLVSFFRAEAERRMHEDTKNNIIYAIEEPETAQHPKNQKILLNSFKEMSVSEDCQVVLTTHSPAVAHSLPSNSLRFIKKIEGVPTCITSEDRFEEIADELGIFPDDRVRALICVEGPNDVTALKALSHALHHENESIIDLSTDPRIAFVPLGGGSLGQWVSQRYLKGFGRREFHLYDNDVEKYQLTADEVNRRGNGDVALLTERREIENYLHPDVIRESLDVNINFGHMDDVPKMISDAIKEMPDNKNLSPKIVKKKLASEAFQMMTAHHIHEVDPDGEILSWLKTIDNLLEN